MARTEGLRPIGESVRKIIEKVQKERADRKKKNKSIIKTVSCHQR